MTGSIFLNGHPKEAKSFARLTAYCEQVDVHNTFATVREALAFSASLRLPSGVKRATRAAFVEEVIDLLELRPIAERLIGEAGAANGLAPGQRKILTVAVELVSNAPILFLDEPTSGLDSRAGACRKAFALAGCLGHFLCCSLSDALLSQPRWSSAWCAASRARAAR